MKRKILFIIACVLMTIQAMAQNEKKKEILSIEKKTTMNKPISLIKSSHKLFPTDHKGLKTIFYNRATGKEDIRLFPVNYRHAGLYSFNKRLFVFLAGEQKQYLNLASYNLAYMALGWRLNNKLSLTGGVLAIKQFTNASLYGADRSGIRFNLDYSITDRLECRIRGQYFIGSALNTPVDFLFPRSGIETSIILNLGGGSQIGIGSQYLYDNKKEKWSYQSGGNVSVKF
ncbi:hypothetical protein [Sanguibacteroides sp. AM78-02pH3A]|uniref:hypothetical protein n=1 Tax=Sanguibacteroides sp. AM78-02pH3A TaxID=3002646 RepID=UPI0022E2F96C|nr:hypothetical protein [Sanguibacteroides sp. AM78-02pH3A]